MSKVKSDLQKVKRELGVDPESTPKDQQERLTRYLQDVVSAQGLTPDAAGAYSPASLGLGTLAAGRAPLGVLASSVLEESPTRQVQTLRKLRKATEPVLAAEQKRRALRPKDTPGVVSARIDGVVALAPNKRDVVVTPDRKAKRPAWWHPTDPWPTAQFHAVEPGMSIVVPIGASVKAGDVIARAGATSACMGVRKPTRRGSIGEARTVVLPEPMAKGYQKLADYPEARSEEEAVVRYVLDTWAKASDYVRELGPEGEDLARDRLARGDVQGLFNDLKAGGFRVKSKRRMTARDAVGHADRILTFLAGKGLGAEDGAVKKWQALRSKWSVMPSDAVVDVDTTRKLPDVTVDAWRWDGVDWACARGAAIRYRERTERTGEGPLGLLGVVESARRDGGVIDVQYTSKTGETVQLLLKPDRIVTRPDGALLLGEDQASGERVTLRVARIERASRPRVERAQVAYPWAIQASKADAQRLLSEPTSSIQVGSAPPPGFSGRVYVLDKDSRAFLGSVSFADAEQTPKNRWVWLFRDPQPYGFAFKGGTFRPVAGAWPAGQWFIDPAVAADPPNVAAARELAREETVASFVGQLLATPLRAPESVQDELDVLIRAASDSTTQLRILRSMFAALKPRLQEVKGNPRSRLRRLTR